MRKFFVLILGLTIILSSLILLLKSKNNVIETMAVPVSSRTIIVDAGHGSPDEGAVGVNGITEAKLNLKIALKLKNLLESGGSKVILTRSDDNEIYDESAKTIAQKKVSDVKNRVKIGNESQADIFVSIHLNKIPQSQYSGWQTFYNNNEKSKTLATAIQNNLNNTISNDNKRVSKLLTNVYIMKHVEIPISIVECGFLSNKQESENLQNDEYQTKLAWGIYDGINEYFEK